LYATHIRFGGLAVTIGFLLAVWDAIEVVKKCYVMSIDGFLAVWDVSEAVSHRWAVFINCH